MSTWGCETNTVSAGGTTEVFELGPASLHVRAEKHRIQTMRTEGVFIWNILLASNKKKPHNTGGLRTPVKQTSQYTALSLQFAAAAERLGRSSESEVAKTAKKSHLRQARPAPRR
jgi:hypothetical protein